MGSVAVLGLFGALASTTALIDPAAATAAATAPLAADALASQDAPVVPSPTAQPVLTPSATPGTTFAGFNSTTTPERLLDTRVGLGAPAGPVGAGQSITVTFAGRGSVPVDATAVVINVTADPPTDGGFITVHPAGTPRPSTSNINLVPGKTVPNLVVMQLNGGAAAFYNAFGSTHLIADVLAYARSDGHFFGFSPERLLDTRSGIGAPAGKVGPGGRIDVNVLGRASVPTDPGRVGAVVVNVTVDQPSAPSFVTVWPADAARPNASSLNMTTGQTVANLVFAPVGSDGRISFFNESGDTHLIGDIVGWIPSGAAYIPITPQRVLDTRTGLGGDVLGPRSGPLAPGESIVFSAYAWRVFELISSEQEAAAYVLNVTAVAPTENSYLSVFPFGETTPNASNINTVPGENTPNAVVVRPGYAGLDVIRNAAGFTHVVVDIVGVVPRQNSQDLADDTGGSRFHVLYLLGADSVEDPSMPAKIRSELEAANTWLANETGGARIDFGRVNGAIDVTTWRLPAYTEDQLVHWDSFATSGPEFVHHPLAALFLDGFGYPYGQRFLVYINGTRVDGNCGLTWVQYATIYTNPAACSTSVDGWVGDPLALGDHGSLNSELIAFHEVMHALGAVPECGVQFTGLGHSAAPGDLMWVGARDQPVHVDASHDSYFGHGRSDCLDVARSPFLSTVPG